MATGATEFIDSTTADVFIPEVWSLLALAAREANLVFANLADRRYEQNLQFGDTIHVPTVTNLTAQTKTKASNGAVSFETQTETNTDISIATWEYCGIAVESIVKVQANRDMLKLYAGKQGYALALAVDDVGAGLVDDFSQYVGSLTVENTDDEFIRARQYLADANALQEGDCYIAVSPAGEGGMLKMDKYIHNDYSSIHGEGTRDTAFKQAYSTSFYRMPVYVSTNVEGTNAAGHDNAMFQKQALALVMQMKPTAHSAYDINYLTDKVVIEQLYGWKEMRDDHGVWIKGA
jgi:hypothetical protein